jgi:hypothetical protein
LVLNEKTPGQETVAGSVVQSGAPGLPAVLALPLLVIAVSVVLYAGDLWSLARIELAPRVFYVGPVPYLTFALVLGFGLSMYAAVRPPAALAGAAVLFVLLSLISIGQSAITQLLVGTPLPALVLMPVSLVASVCTSVSVMAVAGAAVPALHKRSRWLTALILWPVASFLIFSTVPVLFANGQLDRAAMPHVFFAASLFRQCIIFACIGYWLDVENQRRKVLTQVF